MFKLAVSERAERDIRQQTAYYVEAGVPEIGQKFLESTHATFEFFIKNPEIGIERKSNHKQLGKIRSWRVEEFGQLFSESIESTSNSTRYRLSASFMVLAIWRSVSFSGSHKGQFPRLIGPI